MQNAYRVRIAPGGPVAAPGGLGGAVAVTQADDSFTYVPFGGPMFELYGVAWPGVWVNTNGSLTFGAGSADYSESAAEFLAAPPRVGALWDDLLPSAAPPGGGMFANVLPDRFVATWLSVPEFPAVGANTLQITLLFATGVVVLNFDAVSSGDSIVGISPGLGLAGSESDLSDAALRCGTLYGPREAVFEQFLGGGDPFDLAGVTLEFSPASPCAVGVPERGDDQVRISGAGIRQVAEARENDECGCLGGNGRANDAGVTYLDFQNQPPSPPGQPVGPKPRGGPFPSR